MDWEECLKKNVKKRRKDEEQARALLKLAEQRERFLNHVKNPEEFPTIIVEIYYEILKELISALMARSGFKSYGHECLISFTEKYSLLPKHKIILLDQLRRIRNDINYRGATLDNAYLERNTTAIHEMISDLKRRIRESTAIR